MSTGTLEAQMERLLAEEKLVTYIVARSAGDVVLRHRDMEEAVRRVPEIGSLHHELFGGPVQIRRTYGSLENQLLPRIWSQGSVDCFVSKIGVDTLYGLFSTEKISAVETYRKSKKAALAFEELFGRLFGN